MTHKFFYQAFSECGEVVDVWVAYDPPGFAFVEYATADEARQAKEAMHLKELWGVKIR